MWTRMELKDRAKGCLRKYYWMAFLVSLIAAFLTGGLSGMGSMRSGMNGGNSAVQTQPGYGTQQAISQADWNFMLVVLVVILAVISIGLLIGALWGTFMGSVVEVGSCRYFMESRAMGESSEIGRLFWCFKRGRYLNVVKVMFLKNLFVFLWTLLLIVPGIIKSYQYAMVPYILSENPDMDYRDALDLSRRMMDGEKFNLFVLQLSFFGWGFLGIMLCGIGILFVLPYKNATYAELYAVLRKRPEAAGAVLPGYGEPAEDAMYTNYTMF